MADERTRVILGMGERWRSDAPPRKSPPQVKEYPYELDVARRRVKEQVTNALYSVAQLPQNKRLGNEAVLCIRMHPDFLAKSYDPQTLFDKIPTLEKIGSRPYRIDPRQVGQTNKIREHIAEYGDLSVPGRLVFVKGTEDTFARMLDIVETSETERLGKEIRMIERFDILTGEEQRRGFAPNWQGGRVEMVFHPSNYSPDEHMRFLLALTEQYDISQKKMRLVSYSGGPTFVSCWLNVEALDAIVGANPLRTVHPFQLKQIESLRNSPIFDAPPAPLDKSQSPIKVGMFDGGVSLDHELLRPYVEHDESLSINEPSEEYVAHANAVAGAILYGAMNGRNRKEPLPAPPVTVVSVRVLPTSDENDIDLYECIEAIEKAVPRRPDVKWWNLSFGPFGPIIEDEISLFTFALDRLAVLHGVGFCVAVGNSGDSEDVIIRRIQAPSDLVNGFGIGGYTFEDTRIVRAPYSCNGPGRESGKMKPDMVAFSGCDSHPMQLVSFEPGKIIYDKGTSFASPAVAAIGALVTGTFSRSSALMARVLMVHNAKHPSGRLVHDDFMGYGVVPSLEEMLYCSPNSVTIVYRDSINSKQYAAFPIFLPDKLKDYGEAHIKWTLGALAPIDDSNPGDYTLCCIEDTFYPNVAKMKFNPPKGAVGMRAKTLHLEKNADEIAKLKEMGWTPSMNPISASSKKQSEAALRNKEMKWETIVRKEALKKEESLKSPYLIVHAIPRNSWAGEIDFALAVTITLPKYEGDLYNMILRQWALQPITLTVEPRLRV